MRTCAQNEIEKERRRRRKNNNGDQIRIFSGVRKSRSGVRKKLVLVHIFRFLRVSIEIVGCNQLYLFLVHAQYLVHIAFLVGFVNERESPAAKIQSAEEKKVTKNRTERQNHSFSVLFNADCLSFNDASRCWRMLGQQKNIISFMPDFWAAAAERCCCCSWINWMLSGRAWCNFCRSTAMEVRKTPRLSPSISR